MKWQGTCEKFAEMDVSALANWISAIPLTEWPQQSKIDDQLRPAMVHDVDWHGFGAISSPYMIELRSRIYAPAVVPHNRMLSIVMPGHKIPPHHDTFGERWICRVHLPLVTNSASKFIVDGEEFQMETGSAYRVNISKRHNVTNQGGLPRIHFMFDCYEAA